ncbi:MAG: hypothetical protein Q8930_12425 [Bacillota bacterium]|nr:hypothetical protein [Bacillota bacterium]
MAYINVSMSEVMAFVDKNMDYDRERVRSIKLVNQNMVEITVSIGKMFPSMKVVLSFSGFREGKLFCSILTNGGARIVMGLMNEFVSKRLSDYIKLDKNSVEIDINGLLSYNLQGITIRDISLTGEQIYITADFK